jgi:hypothetical protein
MSDNTSAPPPRCRHLCCKAMLVYGEDFVNDPDFQADMTNFWCIRTAKGLGPDGDEVTLDLCSNPERGCYQEY